MIPIINYSLEEGDKGFLLSLNIDTTQLKRRDEYLVIFDSPVSLPKNPPTSVVFQPSSGSYTVFGSNTFVPKIFMQIKSSHRSETKTLIRLTIKDIYNTILYVDYVMIVCSPQSTFKIDGALLTNDIGSNIGPNGGSQIRLAKPESPRLVRGMTVTGPGLSNDTIYTVRSINGPDLVELDSVINTGINYSGTYTFTLSTSCVDPLSLDSSITVQPLYTILDFNNNWTYKAGDRLVAQFIPGTGLGDKINNLDTIVLLPIKNTALLNTDDTPASLPSISVIKAAGRVNNDTDCISELSFY